MAGAVDDFSLLVTLNTPADLLQRPLYHPRLDPAQSKLAEVLAPYHFPEPYPCGLSTCRTPHQSGYLVMTEDQKETNIGRICGARIFGDDFLIKANLQEQRARLKHQLDTLQQVRERRDDYLSRIATLFNRTLGVKWTENTYRSFKEAVGPVVFKQLREKALRNEPTIENVRVATPEERSRHRIANPNGRPLQFVSEKAGELAGLDFLNHEPGRLLTDLKDRLYALEAVDAKTLGAKVRKEWVDWASNIERTFEQVEDTLASALRFFTQPNFELIALLARDDKERIRLSQGDCEIDQIRHLNGKRPFISLYCRLGTGIVR
jgi:hypothetical protein